MNEKTDLTPWHLSTIIKRASTFEKFIEGKTDLVDIIIELNGRGHIVHWLAKDVTDICKFKFDSGGVWMMVYQIPGEWHHAYYVELLSSESISLS